MTTRTGDTYYDSTKARFESLTQEQQLNVLQRIQTLKAFISPQIRLLALNSVMDLELSGDAPPPAPCPPIANQEAAFAAFLRGSCFVVTVMNPYQTPNKQF